jgi:hypothetical protein
MTIDFSCPRCGAPFSVDARMAGKSGRCKKCRHQMTIPSSPAPAPLSAATGMFRLSSAAVGAGAGAGSGGPVFGGISSVGLAPLTEEVRPVPGRGKLAPQKQYSFNPDLLLENSRPGSTYKLVPSHKALPPVARQPSGGKPPGPLARLWRGQARAVLGVIRQLSDLVYLLTIPCVMLILLAVILGRRDLAVMGATGVIALSLVRLALEGVALVAGPFKESPLQGILFLIPPFTFYYLYKHPKRTKKAIGRVLAPIGWMLGVVLAFALIPSLSGADPDGDASALDRARAGVDGLKADVNAELEGQGIPIDQLRSSDTGRRAGQAIDQLKSQVREGVGQAREALREGAQPQPGTNP